MTIHTATASTVHEPLGTGSLWHTKGLQLPAYIQHVATDILQGRGGLNKSGAIRLAVGIVRNWSEGHDGKGHHVTPVVQAAAVKAMAEWEAARAKARAIPNKSNHSTLHTGGIDLATDPDASEDQAALSPLFDAILAYKQSDDSADQDKIMEAVDDLDIEDLPNYTGPETDSDVSETSVTDVATVDLAIAAAMQNRITAVKAMSATVKAYKAATDPTTQAKLKAQIAAQAKALNMTAMLPRMFKVNLSVDLGHPHPGQHYKHGWIPVGTGTDAPHTLSTAERKRMKSVPASSLRPGHKVYVPGNGERGTGTLHTVTRNNNGVVTSVDHNGNTKYSRIKSPDATAYRVLPPETTRVPQPGATRLLEKPDQRTASNPTGAKPNFKEVVTRAPYRPGHAVVGEETPQSDPSKFTDKEIMAEVKYLMKLNKKYGSNSLRTIAYAKLLKYISDKKASGASLSARAGTSMGYTVDLAQSPYMVHSVGGNTALKGKSGDMGIVVQHTRTGQMHILTKSNESPLKNLKHAQIKCAFANAKAY